MEHPNREWAVRPDMIYTIPVLYSLPGYPILLSARKISNVQVV